MFKKTMKFVAATAILGICVFTLSYIYVLRTTINTLETDASMEKMRSRKYTDIIVGGSDNRLESDVLTKGVKINTIPYGLFQFVVPYKQNCGSVSPNDTSKAFCVFVMSSVPAASAEKWYDRTSSATTLLSLYQKNNGLEIVADTAEVKSKARRIIKTSFFISLLSRLSRILLPQSQSSRHQQPAEQIQYM